MAGARTDNDILTSEYGEYRYLETGELYDYNDGQTYDSYEEYLKHYQIKKITKLTIDNAQTYEFHDQELNDILNKFIEQINNTISKIETRLDSFSSRLSALDGIIEDIQ